MSDTKPTNPKDAASTTRLDLSLWPMSATAYGALAMTEGGLKYGGFNYRVAGVQSSVYVAALMRHVAKWYNGEDADPKTLVPHLASALACLGVVIDAVVQGNLNDDRPPQQSVELYAEFEKIVAHLQSTYPNAVPRYRASEQRSGSWASLRESRPAMRLLRVGSRVRILAGAPRVELETQYQIGREATVTEIAWAPDGEAVYLKDDNGDSLGCYWHPDDLEVIG